MSDISAIHEATCPKGKGNKELQLSCDGVSESRSSTVSIDVYSLCFKKCRTIYPYKLIRPLNNNKIDSKKQLSDVLRDILANEYLIKQYIGDNPKRSDAKDCKCHSGWYACEYCFAKGIKVILTDHSKARDRLLNQKLLIEEKISECQNLPKSPENDSKIENLVSLKEELAKGINSFQRKSNILWPFSTMNSQNRSRQSILEIIHKIENEENISIDEAKGIKGRSLLLDIPDFNYIYDAPAEYLHSGCLGLIKRLVELTFDVGVNRKRITKRQLSQTSVFNKLMLQTKVPNESSRRARNLDFAVFKGQEF